MKCLCGCGKDVAPGRKFISGHNLRCLKRTKLHRQRISESLKKAWKIKRKRLPVGSTNHDSYGYVRVKVIEGHGPWKKQHTLVMEEHLGRQLKKGEVIHHIDGNKKNNRLDNLYLCNRKEHSKIERSAEALVKELYQLGIINFNREDGCYVLAT